MIRMGKQIKMAMGLAPLRLLTALMAMCDSFHSHQPGSLLLLIVCFRIRDLFHINCGIGPGWKDRGNR